MSGYSTAKRVLPAGALLLAALFAGCVGAPGMAAYRQGDYAGALREFRAAEDPTGDFAVGVMAYKGEGVARDPDAAADWFRRAAEQGYAKAQIFLGGMYARGEGVAKDRWEAARWFRMAAEAGNTEAQVYLGVMYARGDGVAKNRDEAVNWLRKAAAQGSFRAQEYLDRLGASG